MTIKNNACQVDFPRFRDDWLNPARPCGDHRGVELVTCMYGEMYMCANCRKILSRGMAIEEVGLF